MAQGAEFSRSKPAWPKSFFFKRWKASGEWLENIQQKGETSKNGENKGEKRQYYSVDLLLTNQAKVLLTILLLNPKGRQPTEIPGQK